MSIYTSPPQHRRSASSRESQIRNRKPKQKNNNHVWPNPNTENRKFNSLPSHVLAMHKNAPSIESKSSKRDNQTKRELDASHQKEATRLIALNRIKDKLTGQYLRFDVPDSLDDTVARFIHAVTLRYKFKTPGDSSVHGNFASAIATKEHRQKCKEFAEPLIQRLHGDGITFIRQLLENDAVYTLSSLGVSEEFLILSISVLNVLHQMTGGNYFTRQHLMVKCRHLLNTCCSTSDQVGDGENTENYNLASFLGACGAAGSDDFEDNDNPGGLWIHPSRKSSVHNPTSQASLLGTAVGHFPANTRRSTRSRSWVVPYTAKIIAKNETSHPALKAYRHAKLLKSHQTCSNPKNTFR